MRRVHVKNGLKDRLNNIIGTADGNTNPPAAITNWSVQAAMLENMKRIILSIVGSAQFGRPMKGMYLRIEDNKIKVSSGFSFSNLGDIIVLNKDAIALDHVPNNTFTRFYMSYSEAYLSHTKAGGHQSQIINGQTEELVVDDLGSTIDDVGQTPFSNTTPVNGVLLGWIDEFNNIIQNPERTSGFWGNDPETKNLTVPGDLEVSGAISSFGQTGMTGTVSVSGKIFEIQSGLVIHITG